MAVFGNLLASLFSRGGSFKLLNSLGGSSSSPSTVPATTNASGLAAALFNQTAPLREALFNRSTDFLSGGESQADLTNKIAELEQKIEEETTRRNVFLARPARKGSKTAQAQFQQSLGIEAGLRGELEGLRNRDPLGRLDITATPQFASIRGGIEDQFNNAREAVIGSSAGGGSLTAALAELEGQKATAINSAQAGLENNALDQATSLATGTVVPSLATIQNAESLQAQLAAAENLQNESIEAANKQGLGQALGQLGKAAVLAG